jgi:hypothetical protein
VEKSNKQKVTNVSKEPVYQGGVVQGDTGLRNALAKGNAKRLQPPERREKPCQQTQCLVVMYEGKNDFATEDVKIFYSISTIKIREDSLSDSWLQWCENCQNLDSGIRRRWKLYVHVDTKNLKTGGSWGEVCVSDVEGSSNVSISMTDWKRAEPSEIKELSKKYHFVNVQRMSDGTFGKVLGKTFLK